MKWQWKVHFIRPTVANPLIRLFCAQRAIRLHRVQKTREGGLIPLSTGGFRGSPQVFFLILGASMCVFNGGFYAFGTRFQSVWSRSFARKDISCHERNLMLDKIVFRQSRFFFYFFSKACFLDIISPMSPRFWKVLLALILGGPSKSCVFEKIYT